MKCEYGLNEAKTVCNDKPPEVGKVAKECPNFTRYDKATESCELLEIIHNKKIGQRYIIKGLKNQIAQQCTDESEKCYSEFIGPITDHKDNYIFYLSTFIQDSINITDFTIVEDINRQCTGHIFALVDSHEGLRNPNQYTKEGKAVSIRVKSMANIGSQISRVFISPIKGRLGIIIQYTEGDRCHYDKTKKYSSLFMITCDKKSTHNSPKYIGKADNCTFLFELTSKYGCPSCLKDDVESLSSGCTSGHQNILYREDYQCFIEKVDKNVTGYDYINNDLKNVIDRDILNTIPALKNFFYDFTNGHTMTIPLKEYNITLSDDKIYVGNIKETSECSFIFYENMDQSLIILVIVLPSIYLIVTICMVVFYCKYKRIRSQYQALQNEVDGSTSPREAELSNQIGSSNNI
jgi:hypothetical protein